MPLAFGWFLVFYGCLMLSRPPVLHTHTTSFCGGYTAEVAAPKLAEEAWDQLLAQLFPSQGGLRKNHTGQGDAMEHPSTIKSLKRSLKLSTSDPQREEALQH